MPDDDGVEARAKERQHERAERTERILRHFEELAEGVKFPSSSAELKAELYDAPDEVVGEEESLGSVLDRLDDEYESEVDARNAIMEELGEAEHTTPRETEAAELAETRFETTGETGSIEEEHPEEDPRREPR